MDAPASVHQHGSRRFNLDHHSRMYLQAYPVSCTCIRDVMMLVVLQKNGNHMSSMWRS